MADLSEEQLKKLAANMREAEYKGLSEKEIELREKQKQERRDRNIHILNSTIDICSDSYNAGAMRESRVFLPDDIAELKVELPNGNATTSCKFSCENIDTLVLAQRKYNSLKHEGVEPKILILNMASATTPGGRTREGADAQEEELCRRTSLLLSLESSQAKSYYDYNNSLKTRMGSDAVILSPYVEVIKDNPSEILPQPFPVSVISCAAPMVRLGLEGMSKKEYEDMLYKRIQGILIVAASQGYRHLILGAFGCGIFGNDAAIVSDLFYRAFNELPYAFESVDFAVLCRPDKDYNYRQFCRNFPPKEQ
ncbi:MAG: TIGR02452 family protein [Clostridia bacterium]|nr:TIGR02452 family protein [Clostridia bacterium]